MDFIILPNLSPKIKEFLFYIAPLQYYFLKDAFLGLVQSQILFSIYNQFPFSKPGAP
jgi:hypothetical protein